MSKSITIKSTTLGGSVLLYRADGQGRLKHIQGYTRVYKGIQGYQSSSESTSKMQQSRAEAGLLMLAPRTCNIIDVLTVANTY